MYTKFKVSVTNRSRVLGPRWAPVTMHTKPVSPKRVFMHLLKYLNTDCVLFDIYVIKSVN